MAHIKISVAYFSMEIGLDVTMPTYAGGLGVLAGDTLRSAADMGLAMAAITLLPRKGYFHQRLDASGWQMEEPVSWPIDDHLTAMPERASVQIEGRTVILRPWVYRIKGVTGHLVPVYFLDADLEENDPRDRVLTDHLYGGDARYRFCQEVILGIGGVRMLRALGHNQIERYHMNEGHASLLVLELAAEYARNLGDEKTTDLHAEAVRRQCVFTTHTPVPAGHDQFPVDLVYQVLGRSGPFCDLERDYCLQGKLNLTYLALNNSGYINGVAKRHREVSQHMFAGYHIDSITNGVHIATWAASSFQMLFDRYIRDWRSDNASLRYALNVPREEIWDAHQQAKQELLESVNRSENVAMDRDIFTVGFARRATLYKRADLLFRDLDRLRKMAATLGPLQIIFAGKAHPRDEAGKEIIQRIYRLRDQAGSNVKIIYVPEYDMGLARKLVAGTDLWLNTPEPPMEASGTSGMKAAVNGVPSLSVLDGWWIEGYIDGVTGWAINSRDNSGDSAEEQDKDADSLYRKLEESILPIYYKDRHRYITIMRSAIAINGSFFNTERMLSQYVTRAYFS